MTSDYFVHPTAVVDPGAQIGPNTRVWHFAHICAGAHIDADCVLGQNTYIAGSVRIGRGCRVQNNVSLYDGVLVAEDVFIGPSAVFTNVKNPRAYISRRHEYLPTRIGRGATIGANATVICGVTIGPYAFVGAGATVTRDIPPFALVLGTPARQVGWACQCGLRLPPSLICTACHAAYTLIEQGLQRLPDPSNSRDLDP